MRGSTVSDWEYQEGGRIVSDGGAKTIVVHPNMPRWIIAANMARTTNKSDCPFKAFALSITDRCNLRCDFCCHPSQDSSIPENDCIRMVEEACELSFDEICVTGGEPYLRRKLVYKLANICKLRGRLFGSITNGYWAKDRRKAFDIANEMLENGVTRVTFSWDPSHGEFVSPQTVQNGIDACMHAGMRVCLTGNFKTKDDCHTNYGIDVSAYKDFANFSMRASCVVPAGRGKNLEGVYRVPISLIEAEAFRCPGRKAQELSVFAKDGLAQPCCSIQAGYDMPNLRIGDWRIQSVRELLDSQQGDPYYRIIVDGGFAFLYEVLGEQAQDIRQRLIPFGNAVSPCHLCEAIMIGPDATQIREICDQYLTERLVAVVTANADRLGSIFPEEKLLVG